MTVVAVVVALAAAAAVVADRPVLKAAQAARAMVLPLHAAAALHKAHEVTDKIVRKEVLMAHHPIASTIAMIAATTDRMTEAWTAATTVARAAMSYPVTSTPS